MSVAPPDEQKHQPGEQFNEEITHRDGRGAVLAFASQHEPSDQRHVEKPRDGVLAVRAMGWWRHHAEPDGHPVDADVQKAPDHAAECKEDNGPEMERDACPDFKIEDGSDHWGKSNVQGLMSKVVKTRIGSLEFEALRLMCSIDISFQRRAHHGYGRRFS